MALDAQRQARGEASSIKKDHALQRNEERRQEREKRSRRPARVMALDKVKQLEAELAKESVSKTTPSRSRHRPFKDCVPRQGLDGVRGLLSDTTWSNR